MKGAKEMVLGAAAGKDRLDGGAREGKKEKRGGGRGRRLPGKADGELIERDLVK